MIVANPPWNEDDIYKYLTKHGSAGLDMDSEGQLIINTGLTYDSDNNLVTFGEE